MGAQPSSLSYYRYICLGLAGNLGIVSRPRNLFQELHVINGAQSSEQPTLGEKKWKADAEKTLQRLFPLLSPRVQTFPLLPPSILPPRPSSRQEACGASSAPAWGDLFRERRLNATIRVIAH